MKHKRNEDDEDFEVVRGEGKKKRDDLTNCKWAANQWEAEYYANTDAHARSRARTLRVLMNDPCWYSTLPKLKSNPKKMQRAPRPPRKGAAEKED
jgi:hypothetical protein